MFLGILIVMLFLSFLPFGFNAQKNPNTLFLSFLLGFLTLYGITHYVVTIMESVFWGALLYINLTPLYLMTGPLLYFYVRNTIADVYRFGAKDLLHFLPALIHFIGLIPYTFSAFSDKKAIMQELFVNRDEVLSLQTSLFFTPTENFIIRLTLLSIYTLISLWALYRFRAKGYVSSILPENQKKTTFRWLLMLHFFILISVGSYIVFVLMLLTNPDAIDSHLNNNILNVSGLFLGLLIFSLLAFPDILYGFPKKKEELVIAGNDPLPKTTNQSKSPKENEAYYINLKKELEDYFVSEEPFLSPDFKMADIVVALSTPQHHINYCLKHYMHQTLPQLKTAHRMAWVADALTDSKFNANTIDAIGFKAGYSSKSSFYKTFKDHFNVTPQEFKNQQNLAKQG
ncbi:MAG: helix-turn-helix domain-containing protein [Flavobacteriaceae bacterium]